MMTCLLCAKCCEKTEMLLSNADIEHIEGEAKQSRWRFAYLRDGYRYLKNKGRYCTFLNHARRCSIYDIRPQGCRFYPIIFNPYLNKCVIDKDCTNKDNISTELITEKCQELRAFIRILEDERSARLNRNSTKKRK